MRWLVGIAVAAGIVVFSCGTTEHAIQHVAIGPMSEGGSGPTIAVEGFILIAFFPPVTREQLDADEGLAESLNDFQIHLSRARRPLEHAGIKVYELYTRQLTIYDTTGLHTFVPEPGTDGGQAGYYYAAPGKEPLVSYGVGTDVDIVTEAREFFGLPQLEVERVNGP